MDFVGPSSGLYNPNGSSGNVVVESQAYAVPGFDREHGSRWGRFAGTWPGFCTGDNDTIKAEVQTYQPAYVVALLGVNDLFWFSTMQPSVVDGPDRWLRRSRDGRNAADRVPTHAW